MLLKWAWRCLRGLQNCLWRRLRARIPRDRFWTNFGLDFGRGFEVLIELRWDQKSSSRKHMLPRSIWRRFGTVLTSILRRFWSAWEVLVKDESLKWQTSKIFKNPSVFNRFQAFVWTLKRWKSCFDWCKIELSLPVASKRRPEAVLKRFGNSLGKENRALSGLGSAI